MNQEPIPKHKQSDFSKNLTQLAANLLNNFVKNEPKEPLKLDLDNQINLLMEIPQVSDFVRDAVKKIKDNPSDLNYIEHNTGVLWRSLYNESVLALKENLDIESQQDFQNLVIKAVEKRLES